MERFEWTPEWEEAFSNVKNFVASPLILTHPRDGSLLLLYLLVTDHAMNLVLVQEIEKEKKHMYFVSKILEVLINAI